MVCYYRPVRLEDLALIGNCQFAALVASNGDIVWCCLPRLDSEPVFSSLLDDADGGSFGVGMPSGGSGEQCYLPNSNVLETTFRTGADSFRVIDFAPRFMLHDRMFRPTRIVRIIEPITGSPRVRVVCAPRLGWSREPPIAVSGSNHIQYEGFASPLRLTTDIAPTYCAGQPFTLTQRHHLVLSWGPPVEEALPALCDRCLLETLRYWQRWVKHCNIPPHYQREVIRSALALKLHCFEDTGAIIASVTTSIPEAPRSGRTWDYRYCWLRDAYYALEAFRLLGHFEERENFTRFLIDIAGGESLAALAPLYRIDGTRDLEERILPSWPGFNGDGPVRVGNAAARQVQHDVYGEMVLALAPVFLDERFTAERNSVTLDLLVGLTRRAIAVAGTPDAGIWEHRADPVPRTFSAVMSWAAADRMRGIAARHAPGLAGSFAEAERHLRQQIIERAWNPRLGAFSSTYGGDQLDASLLEMANLRFLPQTDTRLLGTIEAIRKGLSQDGWLLRYRADDGLGSTTVAFLLCSYWLVEALAAVGQPDEARRVLQQILRVGSPLGLLAEDCDTATGQLWGNYPQAYSHVGMIHAAFAASPRWADVL